MRRGTHLLYLKSHIRTTKSGSTLPKLKTSAKSVQTTAEVCTDFSCSLQKVLRTYKFKYAYLRLYLCVLTEVFTRAYRNEYDILT